jgi:hypothetical protein
MSSHVLYLRRVYLDDDDKLPSAVSLAHRRPSHSLLAQSCTENCRIWDNNWPWQLASSGVGFGWFIVAEAIFDSVAELSA